MIVIKPLPRERVSAPVQQSVKKPQKRQVYQNFTIHAISKGKINKEQMAWIADRVAILLQNNRHGNLSKNDINTAIEYIRFLLSKMQLLKTRRLTDLARELLHPGEVRRTRISSFARPKKARTARSERSTKRVA